MAIRKKDPAKRDDGLRQVNVDAFVNYTRSKPAVQSVEEVRFDRYIVHRERDDLDVVLVNIYTVSEGDIEDILAKDPGANVIVTVSAWNGYTSRAEMVAKRQRVALFTFTEFMGAVHYYDTEFIDYIPPDERKTRTPTR